MVNTFSEKKKKNTEKIELQIGPGNCANISNGKGWKKRISVKMTQWILKSANRKTWGGGIEVVKKRRIAQNWRKEAGGWHKSQKTILLFSVVYMGFEIQICVFWKITNIKNLYYFRMHSLIKTPIENLNKFVSNLFLKLLIEILI